MELEKLMKVQEWIDENPLGATLNDGRIFKVTVKAGLMAFILLDQDENKELHLPSVDMRFTVNCDLFSMPIYFISSVKCSLLVLDGLKLRLQRFKGKQEELNEWIKRILI